MAQKKLTSFFNISDGSSSTEIPTTRTADDEVFLDDDGDDESLTMRHDSEQEECEQQPSTSSCVSPCECRCCTDVSIPYHPLDVSESKISHAYHNKEREQGKLKSYARKIQPSWYEKYPWISVCTSSFKIFCTTCRHAKQQNLLTFSKSQKPTFIEEGFRNWGKALSRFQEHEKSITHREAVVKMVAKSGSIPISARLN